MNASSIPLNFKDMEKLALLEARNDSLEKEKQQIRAERDSLQTQVKTLSQDNARLQQERDELSQSLLKTEQEAQLASKRLQEQLDAEKSRLLQTIQDERQTHDQSAVKAQSELADARGRAEDLQNQLLLANSAWKEETRTLRRDNELLTAERNSLTNRLQTMEGQLHSVDQRREGEAVKRVEFLRSEMISLIDRGIELEKDALKAALPQNADGDGDTALQVWRQGAVERVSNAWQEEIVYGTTFAFFRAMYRLRVAIVSIFISLGLLCRRGRSRLVVAAEQAKCRHESAAAYRQMEQNRKDHEAQMERERRSNEAQIKQAKRDNDDEMARAKAELAARVKDLDERAKALDEQQESMEHKIRAYKRWRLLSILLLLFIAAVIFAAVQSAS